MQQTCWLEFMSLQRQRSANALYLQVPVRFAKRVARVPAGLAEPRTLHVVAVLHPRALRLGPGPPILSLQGMLSPFYCKSHVPNLRAEHMQLGSRPKICHGHMLPKARRRCIKVHSVKIITKQTDSALCS